MEAPPSSIIKYLQYVGCSYHCTYTEYPGAFHNLKVRCLNLATSIMDELWQDCVVRKVSKLIGSSKTMWHLTFNGRTGVHMKSHAYFRYSQRLLYELIVFNIHRKQRIKIPDGYYTINFNSDERSHGRWSKFSDIIDIYTLNVYRPTVIQLWREHRALKVLKRHKLLQSTLHRWMLDLWKPEGPMCKRGYEECQAILSTNR